MGDLSKKQFEVLIYLEKNQTIEKNQREIATATNLSLGTVNKIIAQLSDMDYIQDNQITGKGLTALEPYRVKRAVFIAAGFGSRLVPITLNTPKPLVRVNGTRIIDTLLDAVIRAEIEEIIIVRGYLGEQFDQLLYKYPNIKFVTNPYYNEANNISSAVLARDLFENAYVFEADLVLYNQDLVTKYQYESNYLGVPVERTDDWCFKMKNGYISMLTIGARDCFHMFGISYWSKEDGKKLQEHVKVVYEMPGGKERYWDQVALEYFQKDYKVAVRPCSFEDIIEVDTFNDLKNLDHTYR